jgi:hypothetical protein
MTIIERLQGIDKSIVESTHPPATASIRNQLALVTQELELYLEQLKSLEDAKKEASRLRSVIEKMKASQKPRGFGRDRNGLWNPLGV